MALLAFDVAGNACSAAVWSGGGVVSHVSEDMERGQAEAARPNASVRYGPSCSGF